MKRNLYILMSLIVLGSMILAACGGGAPATEAPAPAATEPSAATQAPAATEAPATADERAIRDLVRAYQGLIATRNMTGLRTIQPGVHVEGDRAWLVVDL